MKKIFYVLLVVLIIIIGIVFLGKKKISKEVSAPAPLQEENGEIVENNDFYKISAKYPIESKDKDEVMKKFVEYVVNEKKEAWKIGGELYQAEQDLKTQFPDRPVMVYELNIQYSKYESLKKGTVSYVFTNYEFTGGAHGNTSLATFTFDKNGQVFIDNLVNLENNKDIAITKLIALKLPKVLGEMADEEMINTGLGLSYLKKDGITLDKEKCKCDGFLFASNLQNFIVKDEGIIFIMGQYQVAPYVAGMPEVMLSWEELNS